MSASESMLRHRYAFLNDQRYGAISAEGGRIRGGSSLQRHELFGGISARQGHISGDGPLQRGDLFGAMNPGGAAYQLKSALTGLNWIANSQVVTAGSHPYIPDDVVIVKTIPSPRRRNRIEKLITNAGIENYAIYDEPDGYTIQLPADLPPAAFGRYRSGSGRGRGRGRRAQMVRGPTHGGHRGSMYTSGSDNSYSSDRSSYALTGSMRGRMKQWLSSIKQSGKVPPAARVWLKQHGLGKVTPKKAKQHLKFLLSAERFGNNDAQHAAWMQARMQKSMKMMEAVQHLPFVLTTKMNTNGVLSVTMANVNANHGALQRAAARAIHPYRVIMLPGPGRNTIDLAAMPPSGVVTPYKAPENDLQYAPGAIYGDSGTAPTLTWNVERERSRLGGTRYELYDPNEVLTAVMEVDAQGNVIRSYSLHPEDIEDAHRIAMEVYIGTQGRGEGGAQSSAEWLNQALAGSRISDI